MSLSFHDTLFFSVLLTVLMLRISFFSVVKMGSTGMEYAWHNRDTGGRKGELKREGRMGESIAVHWAVGVEVAVSR